jgi:hypothetical protein
MAWIFSLLVTSAQGRAIAPVSRPTPDDDPDQRNLAALDANEVSS